MRPKTSVQPVIALVRRQHLSELLRRWRRQPRKRSPLLFWALLSFALVSDSVLLSLAIRLLSTKESSSPPPIDRRILVPYADDSSLWEPLRNWVIRVDGRKRLFEGFCREAVLRITGEERFEGRDPMAVVVSWMLDKGANSLQWDNYPFLRCEDSGLRATLYRDGSRPSQMAREEQLCGRFVEPMVVRSALRCQLSSEERQTGELRERIKLFDQIRVGYVDAGSSEEMQNASAALSDAYHEGNADVFAAALSDYVAASRRAMRAESDPVESRRLAWESWLLEYSPHQQALYWSLLAAGLFTIASMVRSWRRCCLLAGRLVGFGCLIWSAAALLGQSLRDGTPLVGDGSQGVLWFSAVIIGVALFLAALLRDEFFAWTGTLLSSIALLVANHWPLAFIGPWPALPRGEAGDICLRVHVLMLLSAYAVLILAWGNAVLSLARVLLSLASAERLCRLATLSVRMIGIGVIVLAASVLLYGCRALQQGICWSSWNAQASGALLVLPGCVALLYTRWRGRVGSFPMLALVVLGFVLLAVLWQVGLRLRTGIPYFAPVTDDSTIYLAGLISLSLTAHAALRYYFGRQRILIARKDARGG